MSKILFKAKILKLELKGFFVFSQWFFFYYHVNLGIIWYLAEYKKNSKHVYDTTRCIGGALTLRAVCAAPSGIQKPLNMILKK
jgi:hypothetical protein